MCSRYTLLISVPLNRKIWIGSILTINLAISVSVSADDLNRTHKYGDRSIAPLTQTASMPITLIGYMDKKGFLPCAQKLQQ